MSKIRSFNDSNKRNLAKFIKLILDSKKEIPNYLTDMVLTILLWAATERGDNGVKLKYFGQPYWSKNAIKKILENKKKKQKLEIDLRHDHSIPKNIILNKLKNIEKVSEEKIFTILQKEALSVVISKEDDNSLSKHGFRKKNPSPHVFSRYKKVDIEIYDVFGVDLKKITKFPSNIEKIN